MYKLLAMNDTVFGAYKEENGVRLSFTFSDPANTDYANFKAQINADKAQLEDADGNLMSADAAKEFVATLP